MKITLSYEWPLFKPFPGHVPMLMHVERSQDFGPIGNEAMRAHRVNQEYAAMKQASIDYDGCPKCRKASLLYAIESDSWRCYACGWTGNSLECAMS